MAELRSLESAEQQHRHEIAETCFDRSIRIDVDLGDSRAGGLCELRHRSAHLVTEMAIRADEERELDQIGEIGEGCWNLLSKSGERAEYANARGGTFSANANGSAATVKPSGVRSTPK